MLGGGQSICRAVPSAAEQRRTAGDRKCDYEGHHCCVPSSGQNSNCCEKAEEGILWGSVRKYYCNPHFFPLLVSMCLCSL